MYDVAIIGSGLGGSITGMLLAKLGYRVLLIEKGTHPRFALGESSTPVMSKKIRFMGHKYGIPELVELSSYDRIMGNERPLTCGPKELFHYFYHDLGQTDAKSNGEYREIIVQTPDIDTQFLRADLDCRLVEYAVRYGVDYRDNTEVTAIELDDDEVRLRLRGVDGQERIERAAYLVDATGFRSMLAHQLELHEPQDEIDTPLKSRCIFSHFKDVGGLEDAIRPTDPAFNERLSIDRVRATQHHCFDGGWYWFIPFDNGVTSVGLCLDIDAYPDQGKDAKQEFWEFTNRFPIVRSMLDGCETTLPYWRTDRMQFKVKEAVGDRWALLPAAAVGMDAWFSTGMGLTLIGIDRLVSGLHEKVLNKSDFRRESMMFYEQAIFKEWWYITRMIDGIYKSLKHYELFKYYCFFCFMGAESFVHNGGIKDSMSESSLLLNVGNDTFTEGFNDFYERILRFKDLEELPEDTEGALSSFLRENMRDFNYRDYGNPEYQGIYYRLSKESPFFESD